MFYRLHADGKRQPAFLHDLFGGPRPGWCWMICGGPSLADLPIDQIATSPAPRFAINLAGSGLLRPTFWTSYDTTARFHRSIYLDASVLKFVHRCRAMDLIPETTFKVCDAPATLFFDRDRQRGFHDVLTPNPEAPAILDWQDSFLQAIDIAVKLGFRRLILAGCDLHVAPAPALIELARSHGVDYQPRELLRKFLQRCRAAGLSETEIASCGSPREYHFDEHKPLAATVTTDEHYFRVSQYLRLSRRALALAGVELLSVTPGSRLNDYFDYLPIEVVASRVLEEVGDPARESTAGRYTESDLRLPAHLGPMRDYQPHFWKTETHSPARQVGNPAVGANSPANAPAQRGTTPTPALLQVPEFEVGIDEVG